MRFVFLNQYYPPDEAPTGAMLKPVAEELARRGHEVTVICSEGGYGRTGGRGAASAGPDDRAAATGVRTIRVRALRLGRRTFLGKLADYASYYLGCAIKLATMRPDRVVALTTPPYLSVLARLAARWRGGRHAHWVMDLYPDAMAAHGMLREESFGYRLLAALARWGFGGERSAGVLTLGPDMAERIARLRGPGEGEAAWIPLWETTPDAAGEEEVAALRARRGWREGEPVAMYSGNMGLGHRFDELLDWARRDGGRRFRLACYGRGKRRGEIERFLIDHPACLELHDYVPEAELAAHLRAADLHVASLRREWTGTMVPSKLQGIFGAGRPVLFIGGRESSIGAWVLESGAGWVVEPGDAAGLAAAMAQAGDPERREAMGERARRFAAAHFDRATNVARVADWLLEG